MKVSSTTNFDIPHITASFLRSKLFFGNLFSNIFIRHSSIFAQTKIKVFTAVTMKNGVFWDVKPCRSFFAACVGC
jgi:hypothetical protein